MCGGGGGGGQAPITVHRTVAHEGKDCNGGGFQGGAAGQYSKPSVLLERPVLSIPSSLTHQIAGCANVCSTTKPLLSETFRHKNSHITYV